MGIHSAIAHFYLNTSDSFAVLYKSYIYSWMALNIMTNSAIELHDSIISVITHQADTIAIHFAPAYIHKSEQSPGIDAGTGWVQDAKLIFYNASMDGRIPVLPEDVCDGEIVIGSDEYQNTIPIPLNATHNVNLHVYFRSGDHITINGPCSFRTHGRMQIR